MFQLVILDSAKHVSSRNVLRMQKTCCFEFADLHLKPVWQIFSRDLPAAKLLSTQCRVVISFEPTPGNSEAPEDAPGWPQVLKTPISVGQSLGCLSEDRKTDAYDVNGG